MIPFLKKFAQPSSSRIFWIVLTLFIVESFYWLGAFFFFAFQHFFWGFLTSIIAFYTYYQRHRLQKETSTMTLDSQTPEKNS